MLLVSVLEMPVPASCVVRVDVPPAVLLPVPDVVMVVPVSCAVSVDVPPAAVLLPVLAVLLVPVLVLVVKTPCEASVDVTTVAGLLPATDVALATVLKPVAPAGKAPISDVPAFVAPRLILMLLDTITGGSAGVIVGGAGVIVLVVLTL